MFSSTWFKYNTLQQQIPWSVFALDIILHHVIHQTITSSFDEHWDVISKLPNSYKDLIVLTLCIEKPGQWTLCRLRSAEGQGSSLWRGGQTRSGATSFLRSPAGTGRAFACRHWCRWGSHTRVSLVFL